VREIVAISVQQPWAGLIAEGRKTIEMRSWKTNHRGELLIVSSRLPRIEPAGCALAVVRLVDCRRMEEADLEGACMGPRAITEEDWAWVLEGARMIEPFEVLGRLGFFRVAVEEEQLRTFSPPSHQGHEEEHEEEKRKDE